jgi:hypothetical protein
MSVLTRMTRVLTFRSPLAPFVKLQYNMNDHHFSLFHRNQLTNHWLVETPSGEMPSLKDLEAAAEHALQLESLAIEHERRADDADFTDLFPSY